MKDNSCPRPSEERVWMKHFSSESQNIEIPEMTAYSFMKKKNLHRQDSIAINYYGNKISFRKFFSKIDEVSNSFASLCVEEGDIVSFISVQVPECIFSIYALNKLGAAANTVDPRMDIGSIQRMISESGSKITVILDYVFPKIEKIVDSLNQKIVVISLSSSLPYIKRKIIDSKMKVNIHYSNDIISWADFIHIGETKVSKEVPYVGDRLVAITYTGGTTGHPKGVMLTNDSLNSVALNFINCGLDYEPGQSFLGIIPIFSSYGLVCGMHMPLCMNLELIPIPKFDPREFGKLVKKFKPNHMISTPAFYEMLIDSKEMRHADLSFLITLGSGGDTMNSGIEEKLTQFMKDHKIRYPLAQGYGMSELSAAASFCVNRIYKPRSVGVPSPLTVMGIFDPDTGEELGYGQTGEICVSGPTMMKGYWNRPEETSYVMREHDDGTKWIHSGDLGYIDDEGFVFVIGRLKRMITRFDGHKVFPVNLEGLISAHDSVHNCAVIGVNDMGHGQGQYPLVIVELIKGTDPDEVCIELYDMCNSSCEERGKPVAIISVDEIPLTGMGKNDYRSLEKVYSDYDYTGFGV